MLINYEEEQQFFDIKRGSEGLSATALIMLERTMFLAIILLLVKYRFQNH